MFVGVGVGACWTFVLDDGAGLTFFLFDVLVSCCGMISIYGIVLHFGFLFNLVKSCICSFLSLHSCFSQTLWSSVTQLAMRPHPSLYLSLVLSVWARPTSLAFADSRVLEHKQSLRQASKVGEGESIRVDRRVSRIAAKTGVIRRERWL